MLLVALAMPGQASAQILPRPCPISLAPVADIIADAGIPVSRDGIVAAFANYLDDFEVLAARADRDLQRLRDQSRTDPGAFLGVRDTVRANEIVVRTMAEHADAVRRMCLGLVPEAAVEEHAAALGRARAAITLLAMLKTCFTFPVPEDIAAHVSTAAGFANIEGRVHAYSRMAKAQAERRLAAARIVEERGDVGRSAPELGELPPALSRKMEATDPAWIAIIREQMVALRIIEGDMSPAETRSLHDVWMPRLLQYDGGPLIVESGGNHIETPAELVRFILRIERLNNDQRSKVREVGRSMIAVQRGAIRRAIDRLVETGEMSDPDQERMRVLELFNPLWTAAGLEVTDDSLEDPRTANKLLPELEAADSQEFGPVEVETRLVREGGGARPRIQLTTAPPDAEFIVELCAWLGVPEDKRAIVDAVVEDACECYRRGIALPPSTESLKSPFSALGMEEQLARLGELADERLQTGQRAFAAARECERAMFTSLSAAFPEPSSMRALQLAEAIRWTEGVPDVSWAPVFRRELGGLRAVFESPMSDASRRAAIAECAPHARAWRAAAELFLIAQLEYRALLDACIAVGATGDERSAIAKRKFEEADLLARRASEAQRAAVQSMTQAVAGVISAGELDAWNACIRRLEWPGMYKDIQPLAMSVEQFCREAPDALATEDVRDSLRKLIAQSRVELQRIGDAAREVAMYQHPRIGARMPWGPAMHEWYGRLASLLEIGERRFQVAEERVRLKMPAGWAARIPGATRGN